MFSNGTSTDFKRLFFKYGSSNDNNLVDNITNGFNIRTFFTYRVFTDGRSSVSYSSLPYSLMSGKVNGWINAPLVYTESVYSTEYAFPPQVFYDRTNYQYTLPYVNKVKGLLGFW